MNSISIIRDVVSRIPAILPHLRGRARWIASAHVSSEEYKTADQMQGRIENLVKALYKGTITAASFVDSMAALISRQITLAYREAWNDEGDGGKIPDYLTSASDEAILAQFDFVDQYARDIVDARVDKTPIDPLLSRAALWANRYTENYNNAVALIALQNGGKLEWVEGDTEEKCDKCQALDGIVAYASEWMELGLQPQNAPNEHLKPSGDKTGCSGWHCSCGLLSTDKRRTKNAMEKIRGIIR